MRFLMVAIAVAVSAICVGPVAQPAAAQNCQPTVTITGDSTRVMEGYAAEYKVKIMGAEGCAHPMSVDFYTEQMQGLGTATAVLDYTPGTGTRSWGLGSPVEQTISITTIAEDPQDLKEPDELLKVCLTNAVGVEIKTNQGCALRLIDSTPLCARPGDPNTCLACSFRVELPQPARQSVWVSFSTHDGTALAGQDFVGTSGRVEIPAGASSADFAVDIMPNPGHDPEEFFVLELGTIEGDHAESQRFPVTITP